jgi:hypothetical protein
MSSRFRRSRRVVTMVMLREVDIKEVLGNIWTRIQRRWRKTSHLF